MWKEIALVVAVLAPAAGSQLVAPAQPRAASAAPVVGASFKPVCSSGAVVDSRPDPAWVRASFARDNCIEPPLPPVLDGAKASRAQIVAAMAGAKAYAASAGLFRKCVDGFVEAKRLQAAHGGRALTPSDFIIEDHRILASEKSAARADAQVRVAIQAFNAYGSGCDDP